MNTHPAVNDGGLLHCARPDGFEAARCRWGCKQLIWWARIVDPITLKTKRHPEGLPKKVPLNPGAHPDGTWTRPPNTIAKVRWAPPGEVLRAEDRYQGHHATCPNAQSRPRPREAPRPRQAKAPKPPKPTPPPDPQMGLDL